MEKYGFMGSEAFRSQRVGSGLSLAQVALGICSESYLSLIEAGKRVPSKKIREQLLARLSDSRQNKVPDALSLDFRVAEMAMKIGDSAAADNATAVIEDHEERKLILALQRELHGDLENALVLLKELSEPAPKSLLQTKVALALTRINRDLGFTEQAIACGEKELAINRDGLSEELESSLLELRAVLSSCYLVKGEVRKALEIANEIQVHKSESWETVVALWAKASALEANGDFAGALDISNVAVGICIKIDRPIAEARLRLTSLECLIELEKGSAESIGSLQHLIEFFQSKNLKFDVAETLLIASRAHFLASDFMRAVEALEAALVIVQGQRSELGIRIHIAMSGCYLAIKSLGEARTYLEIAYNDLTGYLNASPTMASSWKQMGEIYSQLGDAAKAYECLLRATEALGLRSREVTSVNQFS